MSFNIISDPFIFIELGSKWDLSLFWLFYVKKIHFSLSSNMIEEMFLNCRIISNLNGDFELTILRIRVLFFFFKSLLLSNPLFIMPCLQPFLRNPIPSIRLSFVYEPCHYRSLNQHSLALRLSEESINPWSKLIESNQIRFKFIQLLQQIDEKWTKNM